MASVDQRAQRLRRKGGAPYIQHRLLAAREGEIPRENQCGALDFSARQMVRLVGLPISARARAIILSERVDA